jgi:hypothetical protein
MATGAWKKLLDDANLSPEVRAKVEADIGSIDKLTEVLEGGVMRQQDYSRKANELSEERKTIHANWDKANAEYQEMLADRNSSQAERDQAQAERDDAAKKLKDAEEKAKNSTVDTSKFLSTEEFEKRQREYAAGQTAYFGRTLKIVREHQKLFGSDLDPEEFIQGAMEAKKLPDDYWEEKYQVKAKRKEITEAEEKKRVDDAEKRGYEKRLSEEANPNLRTLDSSKNPFYETSKAGKSLQPWDEDEAPQAEKDFVRELSQARG